MVDVRRLPMQGNDEVAVTLDELAREGACRMIAARKGAFLMVRVSLWK